MYFAFEGICLFVFLFVFFVLFLRQFCVPQASLELGG